jgi:hypothetical protein
MLITLGTLYLVFNRQNFKSFILGVYAYYNTYHGGCSSSKCIVIAWSFMLLVNISGSRLVQCCYSLKRVSMWLSNRTVSSWTVCSGVDCFTFCMFWVEILIDFPDLPSTIYFSVGVLLLEPRPLYQAILGGSVVGIGFVYLILYCIPSARPTKNQRSSSPSHSRV